MTCFGSDPQVVPNSVEALFSGISHVTDVFIRGNLVIHRKSVKTQEKDEEEEVTSVGTLTMGFGL